MASSRRKTLADVTAKATPNRVVVTLCVAGDLVERHAQLDRELQDLRLSEQPKLGEIPPSVAKAEEVRAIEEAMREAEFEFVFQSIPGGTWRRLIEAHPSDDPTRRWDETTFMPAAVAATCVEPDGMDDPEAFAAFWDSQPLGNQARLFAGAVEANESQVTVPFSVTASAVLRTSAPTSTTASP